jgi:opacity protein-like surface antigen
MIVKKISMLCVIVLCLPLVAAAQEYPRAEIFTGYSYLRGDLDANFSGFDVSATGNFNSWFGVTADVSGHYIEGFKLYSFLFGPKVTFRGSDRVNPYLHTLVGTVRLSNFGSDNVFGWAAGAGIDIKVHRKIAIRVIDITYLLLRDHGYNSHNGRLSSGLVWRFGGN